MPCVVLPLMAVVKFLEWIFAKFFGKRETTPNDDQKTTETKSVKASGCPFAAMGIGLPNPHVGQPAAAPEPEKKELKQD